MRISDWSSDVCSSDLGEQRAAAELAEPLDRAVTPSEREAGHWICQQQQEHAAPSHASSRPGGKLAAQHIALMPVARGAKHRETRKGEQEDQDMDHAASAPGIASAEARRDAALPPCPTRPRATFSAAQPKPAAIRSIAPSNPAKTLSPTAKLAKSDRPVVKALTTGTAAKASAVAATVSSPRSEQRRVGKECVRTGSSRWSPDH